MAKHSAKNIATTRPPGGSSADEGVGKMRVLRSKLTKEKLRAMGSRKNVMQIAPPLHVVRPAYLHADNKDLATNPLASPTGPGGAAGFSNRAGSQIAVPEVTNIYLGQFWGDRELVEGFSKAIVENGYLDPLRDLGYGTGSGSYKGSINNLILSDGDTFHDSDAQATVQSMLDAGSIQGNANSLFVLILPDGVTAVLDSDGSKS